MKRLCLGPAEFDAKELRDAIKVGDLILGIPTLSTSVLKNNFR